MGNYDIWIDDDIKMVVIKGNYDKPDIEAVFRKMSDISAKSNEIKALVGLRKTGRGTIEARRAITQNFRAEPAIFLKVALFGADSMNRFIFNSIIKTSKLEDRVKHFETEEGALLWSKKMSR